MADGQRLNDPVDRFGAVESEDRESRGQLLQEWLMLDAVTAVSAGVWVDFPHLVKAFIIVSGMEAGGGVSVRGFQAPDNAKPDPADDGYEIIAMLSNGQTVEFVIPHWVKIIKDTVGGSPAATSVVMRAYNL